MYFCCIDIAMKKKTKYMNIKLQIKRKINIISKFAFFLTLFPYYCHPQRRNNP